MKLFKYYALFFKTEDDSLIHSYAFYSEKRKLSSVNSQVRNKLEQETENVGSTFLNEVYYIIVPFDDGRSDLKESYADYPAFFRKRLEEVLIPMTAKLYADYLASKED